MTHNEKSHAVFSIAIGAAARASGPSPFLSINRPLRHWTTIVHTLRQPGRPAPGTRVHVGQIIADEEAQSQRSIHTLQIAAGLLRAQARLAHDSFLREQLERAAARIGTIPEAEGLVAELALGNAVRMDQLLARAVQAAADETTLRAAGCGVTIHCDPFPVPAQAALLFAIAAIELTRDCIAAAAETDGVMHLSIEAIQQRRANTYLTVAASGHMRERRRSCFGDSLEALLAPIGGEVRRADIPGGVLVFAAIKGD